jgi:hypothetical protein
MRWSPKKRAQRHPPSSAPEFLPPRELRHPWGKISAGIEQEAKQRI